MARKIEIEIVGDSKSLERAFGRASSSAKKFNVSLTSLAKSAAVFGLIAAAARGVSAIVRTASDEWQEMAKVAAQTNAVLKSTGGVAKVSARGVANLAGQISRLSGIDDEAIQAGENLLLTFKNVRNELGAGNQIFDRATRSAVNLSVAGFGSLTTTSKQLGKALNDPIRGMTALGRAGVTFSEGQKAQIKSLVESGRLLEAQKIILKEVESQVGGSAKAFGRTLPGQLARLKESFRNTLGGLAQTVARPLQRALGHVNAFIGRFEKAKGVKAKFRVAFEGLEDIGRRVFVQVQSSIAAINWDAAVRTAQDGLIEGLGRIGEALDRINWGEVGRRLGSAIATGMKGAKTFLQSVDWGDVGQTIVQGISNFLKSVDWLKVAVAAVKLMVVAFVASRKLLLGIGKELGSQLMKGISAGIDAGVDFIVRMLLKFVNRVLGLTSFLGRFDPFKDVRAKVQTQLKGMEADTASSVGAMNRSLQTLQDVDITITIDTVATFDGKRRPEEGTSVLSATQGAARTAISNSKAAAAAKAAKAAALARATATATAAAAAEKAAAAAKKATAAAAARAKKFAEARDAAFAALMDSLDLKFDRAQATKGTKDDLKTLAEQESAVRAQIAAAGRSVDLERELFRITQERISIRTQSREAERAASEKAAAKAQSSQFRLLGLNAAGGEVIPGAENLRKQLASVTARIAEAPGQVPSKLTNRLAGVRKLLAKSFKGLTDESREGIRDLFAAIRGEFAKQDSDGPRTKTTGLNTKKIIAGLGLSADQANEIRGRLSGFNSAGRANVSTAGSVNAGTVVVESTTNLTVDGHQMAKVTTRQQQKRKRRNPAQRRGPNRGGI